MGRVGEKYGCGAPAANANRGSSSMLMFLLILRLFFGGEKLCEPVGKIRRVLLNDAAVIPKIRPAGFGRHVRHPRKVCRDLHRAGGTPSNLRIGRGEHLRVRPHGIYINKRQSLNCVPGRCGNGFQVVWYYSAAANLRAG